MKLISDQFDAICFGVCATVAITAAAVACTARETAKTGYEVKSQACIQAYDDRAHQLACLDYVRTQYNEAGAPPAAVDGGAQ